MAVSKSKEKERLKKERIDKLGKELLNKQTSTSEFQKQKAMYKAPIKDGLETYESPWKNASDNEIAKNINKNNNIKNSAYNRMKNDTSSMGYNRRETTLGEKIKKVVTGEVPVARYGFNYKNPDKFEKMILDSDSDKLNYSYSLKNKWEDKNYGTSEKNKQKLLKKKGKK